MRTEDRSRKAEHECRQCKRIPCDMAHKCHTLAGLTFGREEWERMAPQQVLACEQVVPRPPSPNPFTLSLHLPSPSSSSATATTASLSSDPLTGSFDKAFKSGSLSLWNIRSFLTTSTGVITKRDRFHTHLPKYPEGLFPADYGVEKDKLPYRTPLYYRIGDAAAYSIVRDFPGNSIPERNKTVTLVKDEKSRSSATFASIIKTDGRVAIGPLEYCGNGFPITHRGKK